MRRIVTLLFLFAVLVAPAFTQTQTSACSAISLGDMGALNGWVPSPNDAWHQDISTAPLDPNSNKIITTPGDLANRYLHPDFSNVVDGAYGIPYTIVDSSAVPLVTIAPWDTDDSDNTLYPLPNNVAIEGYPGQCWNDGADHHALVIDRATCSDYEIYQADLCSGQWTSYGNVIWDFTLPAGEKRPYGMSSVDAAGLSVFEGLIRYDEIVAGQINHAIRFTATHTKDNSNNGYFTAPAVHAAGNLWGTDNIMGMRIRLKAGFDISGFSSTNQIILNAMKKYGMILADNGGDLFFQGTPDPRWDDNDLNALKSVPNTAFEVVQMGPVYDQYSAPTGPAPQINSFTASVNSVVSGSPVVLTPNVTNGSYEFIDNAGFARGPVTVNPTQTTTYTLWSRNTYGTSTASVTVNVTSNGGTALSFNNLPNQVYGNPPFAVNAVSNSPGAITYSVVSGPATVSGNTVTLTGIGGVTLQASQAASGTYPAATASAQFTVVSSTPNLVFSPIPDQNYSTGSIQVTATSNSSGAITYSVLSGPATISGNTVTFTGSGTVNLQAAQAAAGSFQATTTTALFTIFGTVPTLAFQPVADQTYGVGPFTVSATSNSPGAITYSVSNGPATISGNTVTVTGTGTVTLQARQAAAGGYTAGSALTTFNVLGVGPNLSFSAIAGQTYGAAPFAVSAVSNSPATVAYSVVSGPATISGNMVTVTGVGTVVLQAAQAASGNYLAGTANTSFQVSPASPALAFTPIPSQSYGNPPFTVSAASNSGGAITYSITSGPATLSGSTLTLTGTGSVTVQASQAAAGNYLAATASVSFNVTGSGTNIAFAPIAAQSYGASPFAVSATSNSPATITYSVVGGPATLAGNVVTVTGIGSVTLQASQPATTNYGAASVNVTFIVNPVATNLAFAPIPTQTFGGSPFAVSATSNSPAPISYTVLSGPAVIAGNTVTLTGGGIVTLQAAQAAYGNYAAAVTNSSFNVNSADTILVFAPVGTQSSGGAPFTVSATSNSPAAISYSVVTGPATVVGNVVTLTAAGTVTLQASQAPTAGYNAGSVKITFSANSGGSNLAFSPIATQTFGTAPFAVNATSNSNGAITYSLVSGPATISGNVVTLTGAGAVTLQASQAAAGSYAATTAMTTFVVNPAGVSLAFSPIPTQTFGAAPFAVSATSASTGAVTYSVVSGPALVAGNVVTVTGAGTITLQASQAAAASYGAATATTTFLVNPAVPNLAFASIAPQNFGAAPFVVSATSSSAGAVTYTVVSGPATVSGNVVTLTGAGTVTLQATQAATASYASATAATSFVVTGIAPTLSLASIAPQTLGAGTVVLAANSNSTGAITYSIVSGPATVSGNSLVLTGAGSVTVQATQAAAGGYTAATVSTTFMVNAGGPTLTVATIAPQIFGAGPFTVTANSNSPGFITYTVVSGPAVATGNSVALTGVGVVVLQASQAASGNFSTASVTTSFTVSPANPNLVIASIPTQTFGSGPLTLSSTSASSAPVTFSVLSGPAVVTGTSLALNGAGSVTIQASQPAFGNYLGATTTTAFTISPSSVVLSADFAMPSNINITIKQGSTGTVSIPVSAVNGFSGIVSFQCTVPANMIQGSCNTTNASLTSATSASSNILIGTGGVQTAQNRSFRFRDAAGSATLLAMLLPCGLPFFSRRRFSLRNFTMGLLLALTLAGTTLTTTGCGSIINGLFTAPGTYVIPVKAAGGNASHTMTITVTVQPGN